MEERPLFVFAFCLQKPIFCQANNTNYFVQEYAKLKLKNRDIISIRIMVNYVVVFHV
jgi:hypothetical protein